MADGITIYDVDIPACVKSGPRGSTDLPCHKQSEAVEERNREDASNGRTPHLRVFHDLLPAARDVKHAVGIVGYPQSVHYWHDERQGEKAECSLQAHGLDRM